jgi:glycine betaine/proline transport system permease protein
MALAMVVLASMISAPGLGLKVLLSLEHLNVGDGFIAGFAIVIVAIMIDRVGQAIVQRRRITGLSEGIQQRKGEA